MQVCLLEGLHAVTDEQLPMLTSDFYAKYMLPAKPEGSSPCLNQMRHLRPAKSLLYPPCLKYASAVAGHELMPTHSRTYRACLIFCIAF